MPNYAESSEWADVIPIPQDDGGPDPLAAIAYTDAYTEGMAYLRAVMAKSEMSERALELTGEIISMNAAHYTVWLYRAKILQAIEADLRAELDWLNETALTHQKNYQIWHHRQFVVDLLGSSEGETDFIGEMFALDSKNYHVWSYRQWLVRRFALWGEGQGEEGQELRETKQMLDEDVRNNSAWNHRFFVVCGADGKGLQDGKTKEREVAFAQEAIRKAPQNQSPWNYLRGVLDKSESPLEEVQAFAEEFAGVEKMDGDAVASSHALDLLAEIYGVQGKQEVAGKAYELLAKKYDPIRANYWDYLREQLGEGGGVAASAASATAAAA